MKYSELQHIEVYCDGGCLNNGQSGKKKAYGSFMVYAVPTGGEPQLVKHERKDYPSFDTNNQAEYMSLIDTLRYLGTVQAKVKKPMPIYIHMDSQLVLSQVSGAAKCKSAKLQPLLKTAQKLLGQLPEKKLSKITGDKMKEVLGH